MDSYAARHAAAFLEVMPSTMDEIPELEPVLPRRARPRRRVVAMVAGVLLLAGGTALVAGGTVHFGPVPVTPARPDRIAIVDASGELATIAVDGTDRRSYPVPGLVALFPDWSPDGTHVAVVAANETGGALVVANDRAAGAPAPPATVFRSALGPIYASWSPAGDRLAVLTNETNGLALRIVRPDGSGAAPIVSQGQPLYWDWVDASRLLVHVGGNDPGAFVGEVGVDASRGAALTTAVGPFQSPAISAGGRYRAFVAGGTDGPKVVVEFEQRVRAPRSGRPGPQRVRMEPARRPARLHRAEPVRPADRGPANHRRVDRRHPPGPGRDDPGVRVVARRPHDRGHPRRSGQHPGDGGAHHLQCRGAAGGHRIDRPGADLRGRGRRGHSIADCRSACPT